MNRRIKKILENITDKEPDTFVEENKQKLELFAKTPHIIRLDYLSMRFVG